VGRIALGSWRQLFYVEQWNIGIVDAPVERLAAGDAPKRVRWLPTPPRFQFRADPFALASHPRTVIYEGFSHWSGKGWIAAIDSAPPHRTTILRDLASTAHLSYPYLVEDAGDLFCIPETAELRRVDLFKAVGFPQGWRREATLIENFPALDTTVFMHDGRWWLFCTSGAPYSEHKLHAWHAPALRGPWQPHPLNPLKCDVRSARPAGRPFLLDGALIRPGQDCSRSYGSAVTLNRIRKLTPTEYEEEAVGRVEPFPGSPYPDGLHTICPLGERTVIDGKRMSFSLVTPVVKAAAAIAVRQRRRFASRGSR
jgi:hypothetical protein